MIEILYASVSFFPLSKNENHRRGTQKKVFATKSKCASRYTASAATSFSPAFMVSARCFSNSLESVGPTVDRYISLIVCPSVDLFVHLFHFFCLSPTFGLSDSIRYRSRWHGSQNLLQGGRIHDDRLQTLEISLTRSVQ